MGRLKNSVVGRSVYSQEDNLEGQVLREDGLTLVVRLTGLDGKQFNKRVSYLKFIKYYRLLEDKQLPIDSAMRKKLFEGRNMERSLYGDKGIGSFLYGKLRETLIKICNQDLTFTGNNRVLICLNKHCIFRVQISLRRIIVDTIKDALSADVYKYVHNTSTTKKSIGSARFIFTHKNDVPIMRALCVDLIYHYQIIDYGEKI